MSCLETDTTLLSALVHEARTLHDMNYTLRVERGEKEKERGSADGRRPRGGQMFAVAFSSAS